MYYTSIHFHTIAQHLTSYKFIQIVVPTWNILCLVATTGVKTTGGVFQGYLATKPPSTCTSTFLDAIIVDQ